jgi:hypothetical protein
LFHYEGYFSSPISSKQLKPFFPIKCSGHCKLRWEKKELGRTVSENEIFALISGWL